MSVVVDHLFERARSLPFEERGALAIKLLDTLRIDPRVVEGRDDERLAREAAVRFGELRLVGEEELGAT